MLSEVELRPLTSADVDAHNAGEDAETIRWLTGGRGTRETTQAHVDKLADNARRGAGKQGFGVWSEGRLAGYIDFDPTVEDLPEPTDVNISYAVHPWARRKGVATAAVLAVVAHLRENRIGQRAVIRADRDNVASRGVAERSGFRSR